MRKLIQKLMFFTATVLVFQSARAQQDPELTQYMYNMSLVNPAYATANDGVMSLGALYRAQWVGIDGAPTTATFFAHAPINDRIEMGVNLIHDEIGDVVKETNLNADFAYKLKLSPGTNLAFGLKAGATFFNTDFTRLQLGSGSSSTDLAFDRDISQTYPTLGVGLFYFSDQYYLGASAPNLLNSEHIEERDGVRGFGKETVHYFLTGGYVFDLNPEIKLKPSFMARAVEGAPLSLDLNANVLLYEKLEAGIGYRVGNAITGLVNFEVAEGLRIGYAYDYTTSNLGKYNDGSHEIMLLFDLKFLGLTPKYSKSPRFF
ncbi:type IX secretion system membrane protein PorP/SprF [Flavimarina sp. Hel_I_48]|uniref:PorP/SprF family type IX secretion system membrane protein n=1 Tax=Flavimarina sp. Hel_I_48 TaxID=1392488 RepID=UPI0004DF2B20|nr:type IX secretion system membrane protein PorP/SprF [Flavimarina sp. Hel_I_48]